MSRPPMRPAVDGHNGRPISWPSHPTRTRSARPGFGPPLGPAGREVAVIATLAAPLHPPTASIRAATRRTAMPSAGEAEGPVPLHPPTASIRAATRRTAMPSAGEAEGGGGRRRLGRRRRYGGQLSERCATGPRGRAASRSADRAAASRPPPDPLVAGCAAARPAGSHGWRSVTCSAAGRPTVGCRPTARRA